MSTKLIVGTNEWVRMKNMTDNVQKYPASKIEYDSEVIPTNFKSFDMDKKERYQNLQRKMMKNKWEGAIDDTTDEMYFTHPQYPNRVFDKYTYISKDGTKFMLPLVDREEDEKGLGCSIVINKDNPTTCRVESNEWIDYFDTRKGKRRERYYEYLAAREEKKRQIQEEEEKIKKTKQALSSNL